MSSQFRALCYGSRQLATSEFKLLGPASISSLGFASHPNHPAHIAVAAICHWAQPSDYSSRACAAALSSSLASLRNTPFASFAATDYSQSPPRGRITRKNHVEHARGRALRRHAFELRAAVPGHRPAPRHGLLLPAAEDGLLHGRDRRQGQADRAAHARDSGYFDNSVVPVRDKNGLMILERDDFIKPDTNMDILGGLKPSFEMMGSMAFDEIILNKYNTLEKISHVHTPGNSSGIVDGASAVLIGSENAGRDLNLKPRARILAGSILASDPVIMLAGPGPAAKKCLKTAGLTPNDVDLWEINEAFASVALRYMKDLEIDHSITNVNGGSIAMGHPLGATGAMLVSTMLDELERREFKRGMLSLCVGGGMLSLIHI